MLKTTAHWFSLFVCLLLAVACQPRATQTAVSPPTTPLTLPAGFTAVPLITNLSRPTQFIEGPDGRFWIAQLFAGEGEAQGQVIAVEPDTGEQTVLLSGLNKPTGIAVLDNALWIAEESQLLRAALDETLLPQQPDVVLTGMVSDGSVTGADFEGQPPEELNLVVAGADFGWPPCFGNQEPALNRSGTPDICSQTRAPAALFAPQSTPTSVVVSPWDDDVLLVALWLGGEITAVTFTPQGDNAIGTTETFISGFGNPQHLLVLPDGALMASDYRDGVIYKIERVE